MVKLLEMTADGLIEKHREGTSVTFSAPVLKTADGENNLFGTIGSGNNSERFYARLGDGEFRRLLDYANRIRREEK